METDKTARLYEKLIRSQELANTVPKGIFGEDPSRYAEIISNCISKIVQSGQTWYSGQVEGWCDRFINELDPHRGEHHYSRRYNCKVYGDDCCPFWRREGEGICAGWPGEDAHPCMANADGSGCALFPRYA